MSWKGTISNHFKRKFYLTSIHFSANILPWKSKHLLRFGICTPKTYQSNTKPQEVFGCVGFVFSGFVQSFSLHWIGITLAFCTPRCRSCGCFRCWSPKSPSYPGVHSAPVQGTNFGRIHQEDSFKFDCFFSVTLWEITNSSLAGKWTQNYEDVFPIGNGDIPACYVSLPEGSSWWNPLPRHPGESLLLRWTVFDWYVFWGPTTEPQEVFGRLRPRNQPVCRIGFMIGCIFFWLNCGILILGAKARRKEIHHATDKYTLARFPTKGLFNLTNSFILRFEHYFY